MSKSDVKRDVREVQEDDEIPFSVILKFIKPFNGDREKLTAFLRNCDSAISLSSPEQESVVFRYILSQLEGKAETACSIKDFETWPSLKEFLKTQFGERKHYAHLLTDLQECRQGSQETVSQFSLRVETCLQKLLTEVTVSNSKKSELVGRLAAMEDLALHTFTLGLNPRIANIVRCRDYKTLNDAINAAISEEKIQQFTYRNNTTKPKYVESFPRRMEPNTRYQPRNFNNQPSTSYRNSPFCRYCKKIGHVIENCRLREQNNKRYSNGPQPFTPLQPSSSSHFREPNTRLTPRVNFSNDCEDDSRDEVDNCNEKTDLN